MIVVEIKLVSAVSRDRDEELGTLVLDNITSQSKLRANGGRKSDYRARMYRKGALAKSGSLSRLVANAKHTREAFVTDHARLAEPVQNLVAKALLAMGYEASAASVDQKERLGAICGRALSGDLDRRSVKAALERIVEEFL